MKMTRVLQVVALLVGASFAAAGPPESIEHRIVALEKDRFHGWPANNGVWHWGDEILVGFTQGDISVGDGHNITGRQDSLFARSTDGGRTWTMFDPEGFLDDENTRFEGEGKRRLDQALDLTHEGFALRVFASGYHGNDDPDGGFYYSYDRGATWTGPYRLGDLNDRGPLQGMLLSPRTDYIVQGERACSIFISAKASPEGSERMGMIKTEDGGRSFEFVAWVTPETERARAIMSQTVPLANGQLLSTYRKIYRDDREATIEASVSDDGGQTWHHLSTIKTMQRSSNPPATVQLEDGRVVCVYGDRQAREIRGRYSTDSGRTWGEEFAVRGGFSALDDDPDLGYTRLVQREDGRLVAMYYWATADHPQQHIAASIWMP